MKKDLIDKTKGKVTRIFIPDIYDNGDYLPEENVEFIGLVVRVDDKDMKIIKPRYSEFANVFVGDTVNVNKYAVSYNYDEYITKLKEEIDLYYSHLSEEKKNEFFNKYCFTREVYGSGYKRITEYDVCI